ncbi:MAG: hypothetical protein LBT08_05590 [Synergistaceae bacterium]|nr:hypothetical protein [Synergistaceae bacterium]
MPRRLLPLFILCLALFVCASAALAGDSDPFRVTSPRTLEPKYQRKGDIEPYLTMDTPIGPVLAGIQVHQMGGDGILLKVRGFNIPIPRAVTSPGENKLVLQWDEARFPQNTDKRDWWDDYDWDILKFPVNKSKSDWWKQYDYPLLNRIDVAAFDQKSMRMTFTSTQPLVLERIDGIAGADNISVLLKAYSEPKAPKPEKVVTYQKGDPMAITAPVTLQLRDAEVKSVFRMLTDMQKLNLVIDQSVPDTVVTFSFTNVPYKDVFGYLLRVTDLSYAVLNGTLVVGTRESLAHTLGTEILREYKLSYALTPANGEVRGDLVSALTALVPLSKAPTLDQRNRTLYVTASPEQHEEVAEMLERLDQPGRQVMIQAKIVEVNSNAAQDLESLISGVYDQWLMNTAGGRLNLGYNYATQAFEGADLGIPIAGTPQGSTTVWDNVVMDGGNKLLSAGLTALESSGKGKVLAHPSVVTLDGHEATVALTQNALYASGVDSNGNTTFSSVESGPRINFTPVIGRNGIITIDISIQTGDIVAYRSTGNGAQTPETTTRSVQTMVRVRNGEPFAVGGLYQETKTNTRERIPVLGYIPFLGDLFTTKTDKHVKSEVAMIVVPYILDVPDEEISTRDLMRSSLNQ